MLWLGAAKVLRILKVRSTFAALEHSYTTFAAPHHPPPDDLGMSGVREERRVILDNFITY